MTNHIKLGVQSTESIDILLFNAFRLWRLTKSVRKLCSKRAPGRGYAVRGRTGQHAKSRWIAAIALAALSGAGWGGDDPGTRLQREQQLQRQQQQEALRLRMLQQQRATQSPPGRTQDPPSRERLRIEQQQRQHQLHGQQSTGADIAQPSDDAGTRQGKKAIDLGNAEREGEGQLRRFDSELKNN